jgi:hypothetical protein
MCELPGTFAVEILAHFGALCKAARPRLTTPILPFPRPVPRLHIGFSGPPPPRSIMIWSTCSDLHQRKHTGSSLPQA